MDIQCHGLFSCLSRSNKQEFTVVIDTYLKNTECVYPMENDKKQNFILLIKTHNSPVHSSNACSNE